MDCNCKDYKEGMKQIIDAQRFLAVTRNVEYTGKKIKFCPWCGCHLTSAMHSDGLDPQAFVICEGCNKHPTKCNCLYQKARP